MPRAVPGRRGGCRSGLCRALPWASALPWSPTKPNTRPAALSEDAVPARKQQCHSLGENSFWLTHLREMETVLPCARKWYLRLNLETGVQRREKDRSKIGSSKIGILVCQDQRGKTAGMCLVQAVSEFCHVARGHLVHNHISIFRKIFYPADAMEVNPKLRRTCKLHCSVHISYSI